MSRRRKKKRKYPSPWLLMTLLIAGGTLLLVIYLWWGADALASIITPDQERAIGETLTSSILEQWHIEKSPEVTSAIEDMLLSVQNSFQKEPIPAWARNLHVTIVSPGFPNAFALPGAHIIVTSTLLCSVQSGEELSYVLAHELGHIHYRHPLRSFVKNSGLSVIMNVFFGRAPNVNISATILANRYTREFEREADTFSLEAGRRMGWDPMAYVAVLERISHMVGDDDNGGFAAFRDHPLLRERISLAERYPRPSPDEHNSMDSLMLPIRHFCSAR